MYLVAVGLVLAVAWVWAVEKEPSGWGDTEDYIWQAENLMAGEGWTVAVPEPLPDSTRDDPRLKSRRLPGYAAFLVPIRFVNRSPAFLALFQCLMAYALAWGLWRLVGRLGQEHWKPLVLGLVLTPIFWIAAQLSLADLPFAVLLFLATERVVTFSERQRPVDLAWAHGWLAVGFLFKPVLLYFWPVAGAVTAWMLWRHGARGQRLWPAALAGIIPVMALALAWVHGQQTGYAEVTSLQTQNLWQQNARRAMLRTGDEAEYEATDAVLAAIPEYADRQRQTEEAAMAAIFARPLAYGLVHMQGVAAFALDPGRYDIALFFELPVGSTGAMDAASRGAGPLATFFASQPWPLALVLLTLTLWNAAVAVAFLVWCWRGAAPPEVRVWCFLLVAYIAFVTGPVGAARYRLAVLPILLLALPWAWGALRSRFRQPAP